MNGQVDLATGWDTHRNTMIRNGTITATSNRVIWESEPLPNECVVVRKGMEQDTAARIAAIFASLAPADLESLPWPYTGFVAATHEAYIGLERMGRDLGVLRG